MVKFTSWAHGSRADILAELRSANSGTRSERKHAELSAAISALEAGASHVKVGVQNWVVEGEAAKVVDLFIAEMDGLNTQV